MLWHNATPPTGWLVCNGQEVPIASYGSLYNLITVTATIFPYGANTNGSGSAGSTHFVLPNLTDRFAILPSVTGSSYSNLTKTGGANTHAHNFNAQPNAVNSNASGHYHSYSPGNYGNSTLGDHAHNVNVSLSSVTSNATTNVKRAATGTTSAALMTHGHSGSAVTNSTGDHSHSITGGNGNTESANHTHVVTYSSNTQSISASSVPANQRVYFIVLAVSQ
jgi:microcystin-dependent protein